MFDKIGKKIKITAMVIAGIIIVIGAYIALSCFESNLYRAGVFAFIVSIIIAWLETFTLYGFGEIIDKVTEIAENTKNSNHRVENIAESEFKAQSFEKIISQPKSDNEIQSIESKRKTLSKDKNSDNTSNEKTCPICNVKIEEGRVFCPECGLDVKKRSELLGWD